VRQRGDISWVECRLLTFDIAFTHRFDPLRLYHSLLQHLMLLGDVLLCPPVVRGPREKAMIGRRLRQTTQVEHGEVAFATAMRPSIASDGERLATR
jgi:hypothetical protein